MSAALSREEHELVDLLATGMTDGEIAARLGSSASDVEERVGRLLASLGLATVADLVFAAALGRV